ncbi:MAG: hypothetical protein K0R48_1038 [Gammaproteobacteria bacterium]|nr:hypothetical protein [Gammaproteobacteria bacterium]
MLYLKRFVFTIIFLFLFVGYATQNTVSSNSHIASNKQQLIFQAMGNKLILYKKDIEKIELQPQDDGQTQSIEIHLTDAAAKRFYDFSGRNIGQRMQIVWNGTVLSEAVIVSALPGKMVISSDVNNSVMQEMVSNL